MKKLIQNEAGIAHLLLIAVFVVAIAGASGFAYTRISDKNSNSTQVAEAAEEAALLADEGEEEQKLSSEEEAESNVEE